jgi:hypothetical protein
MKKPESLFSHSILSNSLLLLVIAVIGYLILYSSCANIGMPSGGLKDTIPPVVVRTIPLNNQLNVKDNEVRITFNELVKIEGLNDKFVVSPPVSKRPVFRTKGKTVIVELNDKLKPNTTYSLDFKDGVADNNEGNRLRNLRLAFSTGQQIDTLRISGFVKDAFDLTPVKNAYVLLYTHQSDTLIYKSRPDFVAKTDWQGYFAVTNIPADSFMVYSISDVDNNLKYLPGADSIAFLNQRILPSAKYFPERDSIIKGLDTLLFVGKTRFYPDPVYLLQFYEKGFELRLDKYDHPNRKYLDLYFTESVKDTFNIVPLNFTPKPDWKYIESSPKKDTIRVWLKDSMDYKMDTLIFKLNYLQQDSLKKIFVKSDTVKFYFTDILQKTKNKRKERRKVEREPASFSLNSNLKPAFDIYRDIIISSNEPITAFDTSKVKLFMKKDTAYVPVSFQIRKDSANQRRYIISHKWEFAKNYRLTIDSASVWTIYNLPCNKFKSDFKIQEEEYYGKIICNVQNVTCPTIIQLLGDSKNEPVLDSRIINKDGEIVFQYLEPVKYLLKAIFDKNGNGKWDPGDLEKKIQPEEVAYYPNVIKVMANWEKNETWILKQNLNKKVVDQELELEKAKSKAKKPVKSQRAF